VSYLRLALIVVWTVALAYPAWGQDRALRDIIDQEIAATWPAKKVAPTPPSTDPEFLRRISLDLTGIIPPHAAVAEFLDDTSPDKRTKLIEQLLTSPRFAQHQADLWDLILFSRNPPGSEADRRDGIQNWLARQFADNVPYNEWVRTLLKAEGNSVDEGPPLYLVQYRNRPEDASEAISQTFLGVQLQCARCHDHPFESWKQVEFYGMAAFLARLQVVNVGKDKNLTKYAIGEKSTGDILFTGPAKEQEAGKKGEPVKPKFLLGEELTEPEVPKDFKEPKFVDNQVPPRPTFSRKDQLADWITHTENRFFARAIANRIWAQFMGRGLVHPVDNMSESNEPSHPQLLDTLARELVAHNFDLKWYINEIVHSRTYQLSSVGGGADPLPLWFEYGRTRPLSAEELAESWKSATWYDEVEKQQQRPNRNSEQQDPRRARFQPLERDYVIRFFGTPNTGTGDFQGGLQEHLYLNNGQLGSLLGNQKGGLIEWLSTSKDPVESKIERIYLSTLTRRPTTEESERFKLFLETDKGQQTRWSDVVWALMTCGEFRFNH
jgi:hypothetical protein